jgi:AraC family transcriptional regulator of arabinose operon
MNDDTDFDRRIDPRIALVVDLLVTDGERDAGAISDLAARVNLSPSRLRHLFRAAVGVSITTFIKNQRLERARHLVETTFLSIKQIAAAVAAGDESHFVRDFKRAYGLSPKAHRARTLAQPVSPIDSLSR